MHTNSNNIAEQNLFELFGANEFDIRHVLWVFVSSSFTSVHLLNLCKFLKNGSESINIESFEKILSQNVNWLLKLVSFDSEKSNEGIKINMTLHNILFLSLALNMLKSGIYR